jgi:uncharacterized protein YpiB (UPF0302 family)
MNHGVRVIELPSKEVYVDVNDLIIELLLKVDRALNEHEKRAYKELSDKLSAIRDKAHKTGAGYVHEQKL